MTFVPISVLCDVLACVNSGSKAHLNRSLFNTALPQQLASVCNYNFLVCLAMLSQIHTLNIIE